MTGQSKAIQPEPVTFDKLNVGDRFTALGNLWTKIDWDTARRHGKESIELGQDGFGYLGDVVATIDRTELVVFQPPVA